MKKIIADFRRGVERIRWFASVFSERLRIEMAVVRLLYESDKKARTRSELLTKIGERVLELRNHQEKNILRDSVVSSAVSEIEQLDDQLNDLKAKIAEIGKAGE